MLQWTSYHGLGLMQFFPLESARNLLMRSSPGATVVQEQDAHNYVETVNKILHSMHPSTHTRVMSQASVCGKHHYYLRGSTFRGLAWEVPGWRRLVDNVEGYASASLKDAARLLVVLWGHGRICVLAQKYDCRSLMDKAAWKFRLCLVDLTKYIILTCLRKETNNF